MSPRLDQRYTPRVGDDVIWFPSRFECKRGRIVGFNQKTGEFIVREPSPVHYLKPSELRPGPSFGEGEM